MNAKAALVDPPEVSLDAATLADAELLSNLLELYVHDLSEAFPGVELGPDGRFGYKKLPLYWSEPERRFPFLIRSSARIVGFAFATRGSPASDDPSVFDVAEFFVLRRHRRSDVGRRAAVLLWNRFPGKWTVRVSEGNAAALPFWARIIADFTGGAATEFMRPGDPHPWRVFSFESEGGSTGLTERGASRDNAPMSTEELVRDYWLSIDALDMDRFLSFFTPDCTMGFGSYPLVHGIEGVRAMIAPVFAGVAGMRHQRLGVWVHDDATVARGEVTYTRHDRSTVTIPFMTHFVFAEGRIRSTHVYIDIAPLYAPSPAA